MFRWLSTRLRGTHQPKLEQPPVTTSTARECGASPRRGTTRRPLGMVRLQNRRSNRRARATRRANRP